MLGDCGYEIADSYGSHVGSGVGIADYTGLSVLLYRMRGGERMGRIRDLIWEEDAVGVVEIILILVVLIGLVVIFKDQLVSLVNDILDKITKQSKSI